MKIKTAIVSSVKKVIRDSKSALKTIKSGTALKGEIYSYQFVFKCSQRALKGENVKLYVDVDSELKQYVRLFYVGDIKVLLPAFPEADSNYISSENGMYPDILYPIANGEITASIGNYNSIWVSVELPEEAQAGTYPITLKLKSEDKTGTLAEDTFELEIIDAVLPKQTLTHTEWFHCDSIATYHNVEMFSEEFFALAEKYVRNASKYGINSLLVPMFTPPLDTEIGGERMTAQLVKVTVTNGVYSFDFSLLERYLGLLKKNGVKHFEMSHLFTQWGAKAAPKVIATVDGVEKRIFGWETSSKSEEYISFLKVFLSALSEFLEKIGEAENCCFHISDEPHTENYDDYAAAAEIIYNCLPKSKIIDALSDVGFYEKGAVKLPVPALNKLHDFVGKGINELWTYYCCGQFDKVSNRFVCMPGARTRVLGVQLYKYNVKGFLHWGYNFYFTPLSKKPIDPYQTADAEGNFPAGDPFIVYPGEEPVPSIRQLLFNEALQDMRALQLAESLGVDVEKVINSYSASLTVFKYPRCATKLLNLRENINKEIKDKL